MADVTARFQPGEMVSLGQCRRLPLVSAPAQWKYDSLRRPGEMSGYIAHSSAPISILLIICLILLSRLPAAQSRA